MRPGGLLQPGDIGITALVRARLLGLQILTLDAQVVLGKQNQGASPALVITPEPAGRVLRPARASRPARPSPAELPARPDPGSPVTGSPDPGSGDRLARAVVLLAQGAETLARSRDSHSRPSGRPG